jgi:hypothetical protein
MQHTLHFCIFTPHGPRTYATSELRCLCYLVGLGGHLHSISKGILPTRAHRYSMDDTVKEIPHSDLHGGLAPPPTTFVIFALVPLLSILIVLLEVLL